MREIAFDAQVVMECRMEVIRVLVSRHNGGTLPRAMLELYKLLLLVICFALDVPRTIFSFLESAEQCCDGLRLGLSDVFEYNLGASRGYSSNLTNATFTSISTGVITGKHSLWFD